MLNKTKLMIINLYLLIIKSIVDIYTNTKNTIVRKINKVIGTIQSWFVLYELMIEGRQIDKEQRKFIDEYRREYARAKFIAFFKRPFLFSIYAPVDYRDFKPNYDYDFIEMLVNFLTPVTKFHLKFYAIIFSAFYFVFTSVAIGVVVYQEHKSVQPAVAFETVDVEEVYQEPEEIEIHVTDITDDIEEDIEEQVTNSITLAVKCDKLNVRTSPEINNSNISGQIEYGDTVKVVSNDNGWCKLDNGNYVFGQYLSPCL